ncbi:hypothetical protein B0T19DRAFT_479003 [Cercophora scortea]|uniref:Uncharacterized protein n=1 Tax=Cercophora scortea TaxID=314031 RepID=A0AAE0M657_9PEZI|nr:hypothetical protein B0T19DRAFT_479003 [Cercophora scortea]
MRATQPIIPGLTELLYRPGLPTCECTTYCQFYACGCPDSGRDGLGRPIATRRWCGIAYLPLEQQKAWERIGFRHNPNPPHMQINLVLPFPCFQHLAHCAKVILPQVMELGINTRLAERDRLQQAKMRNKRIAEQRKRKRSHQWQRLKRLEYDVGVLRDSGADPAKLARLEAKLQQLTQRNLEEGWGIEEFDPVTADDDAWLREERKVDRYAQESAEMEGRQATLRAAPHGWVQAPRSQWPLAERDYTHGAYELDDQTVRLVQRANWQDVDPQETWLENAIPVTFLFTGTRYTPFWGEM